MKTQIARFSPHQNAKVFAVLMALASLLFAVPMFIIFLYMPSGIDARGNPVNPPPAFIALMFPLIYLVMGYVMVAVGCWFYNLMFKYVGGIEYETREQ
ncbi:MAG TPA: hypothetical protein VEM34_02510 [Burkholderiales bacterium]|nr:hypothetical protein [Burkholderiales bacterium]